MEREFEIKGKKVTGVEIPLPEAPLVLVYNANGFVMCGYLNLEAAEKMKVAAAFVKGVSTIGDLLNAPIQGATTLAKSKGVKEGQTGQQALRQMV